MKSQSRLIRLNGNRKEKRMKKSLFKNNWKSIQKTRRRFLSILLMALLGVGFYAGLAATSPDMLDSLDRYVDTSKMYDISIRSTLGLTSDDVEALQAIPEIETVQSVQTKDATIQIENQESIAKWIEYHDNVNVPFVVAGREPEKSDECLLDKNYLLAGNMEDYLGKTIQIENDDVDENRHPIFTIKQFTIVGIAESPAYISSERGSTSIGNGKISCFIYVKDDVIQMDYDTEIDITVKGARQEITNSDAYLNRVQVVKQKIEDQKEERQEARHQQLVQKATDKLEDAQKEYDENKEKVEQQLNDAKTQIDQAKRKLEDSENQLNQSEKQIDTQEKNMKIQFASAKTQIEEAQKQIEEKEQEWEKGKQEFENQKPKMIETSNLLDQKITETKQQISQLQEQKQKMEQMGSDTTAIDGLLQQAEEGLQQLQQQKEMITAKLEESQNQIATGEKQLQSAKQELSQKQQEYKQGKKEANRQLANGKEKIQQGRKQIEEGKATLKEKEQEWEKGKKEAQEKLDEAQQKLTDANDEIGKIEKAKWYIQDRMDNTGYSNIFDAIKTMSNIAKIFPIIFYLVAVLISLTSMTRMIEEERIEIGTLKSLGYTNLQIISKYVMYAFLACVIGGVIGMSIGLYLLPTIVWKLYALLYTLPQFYTAYRAQLGLMGILIAFLCIGGATIWVAYHELKEMPAVLMRPKPPKNGKKIFLERITFLWKRLNFSQKVTMRNIFRYKKRAIMTIVGIAGCTGLMLTGFGIKDSVVDIPASQYGGIFRYDMSIALMNTNGIHSLQDYLAQQESVTEVSDLYASSGKLQGVKINYDVTILAPDNLDAFEKVCHLKDVETGQDVSLQNDGIVITDKVASFLHVKAGDEVTLLDSDSAEHTFRVSSVVENYVAHYVYMTKELLEQSFNSYKTNMIFVKLSDQATKEQKDQITKDLLNIEGVSSVTEVSSLMNTISDMLNTMNYVVVILIVASAMLAFIVLYNLANINIGERQREIATLKVLGFYDKEVDNYINKENIIFTLIAVALGLLFGTFLTSSIIASVEIDKLRFIKHVQPISYVYAGIITIIFSWIVNTVIHFVLRKIDMIESLKSVE